MNARLALLGTVEPGIAESEVFRLALQHLVGELGALGAMVHLCGPGSVLRLVSATGLPLFLTRPLEIIDPEGAMAPARALRHAKDVWMALEASEQADSLGRIPWPGTGMAAAPLPSGGRAVGAVTVVMGSQGEPTAEQWDFLRAVTTWTGERMGRSASPVSPSRGESSGGPVQRAWKEVRVGSWDWNLGTGELAWDEAVMALYGIDPADFVPRIESWMEVVHPDDLPMTLAAAEKAIRDGTVYEAEYRARRRDGTYGWTQARGKAAYDDLGNPVRLVGMAWDSNESRSTREALSRALRHMSDGFASVDADWRITYANLEAERELGFPEEELLGRVLWDLPNVQKMPGVVEARFREAAAAGKPVGFEIQAPDTGNWFHVRVVPGPDGVTFYAAEITEKRRQDAERAAAERAASERAARIAELTAALAKATTSRDVVDAVARRVLPPFGAAGLVVQVIEGERLYNVGVVGYPDDLVDRMNGQRRTGPDPSWDAIQTGMPLFISSVEEYVARYPELAGRPRQTGKQAWAFLPLTASGHTFGVCVVGCDRPRSFEDEERTLLTAISALVAQALERARLYDAEHTRSQELQRSLLPLELPDLSACTVAARYLPAGQGMDVGGDWYDVIPLSGGQVALVVGDVMGHGLPQAATMGRLRTAVHTLADLELPPDEIMSHLNDIVAGMGEGAYATCLYALYDSTTQLCTVARAGHPPPAVLRPDGTVHLPKAGPDPPLGAAVPPFETVDLVMPEGSLLVLYTDGLVESATREMDAGMAELERLLRSSRASTSGGSGTLERLCDTLVAGLLPAEQQTADDAALLVARVHALADDQMASWPLPENPQAAGQARKHVREQLSVWGLDDLAATTELLVSELVGNVVRHAKGPVRLRLLHGEELVCEVSDGSLTMPRIRRALETDEGGRGLQLIAALSQRWGTRYTMNGKCIWTEQALPGPDDRDALPSEALEMLFPDAGGFDADPDALSLDEDRPEPGTRQ
ncbi:SpoIIE family protein phosphatase [Streptomyces sp. NPDC090075]|uniref:SpoIIE family protein phosphatase n=1 Tax=Streptomyces sp. NPDC090075 TaxID=3365937 RepID=UPI003808D32A